jgi:DNA adenine methylase
MKTPITYYGGKQRLAQTIIELIPEHICYIEPFFGGGAVYFTKEPSKVEVINDKNNFVINFYKVVKHKFDKLKYLLEETLYSRSQYNEAEDIYNNPENYDDVQKAWAFWILSQMGYGTKINTTWNFGKRLNSLSIKIKNKIDNFVKEYCDRLRLTQIECDDAITIINRFDCNEAFFYVDPPYIGRDQGHYKGYTENDYENLLKALSNIKGKFLLSSYSSDILSKYIKNNNWNYQEYKQRLTTYQTIDIQYGTELLIANYPLKQETSYQNFFTRN